MVGAAAPLIEPGAPGWALRFALRLQQTFWPIFPTSPMRLTAISSTALPPAQDWPGCIVYVPDKLKVGVSTGAAWVSAGGGPL